MADLATISQDEVKALAEALYREHPDADTLYIPAPHWGIIELIDPLEQELGVNVVIAIQAIVWETLRRSGVNDRINGYGPSAARLLNTIQAYPPPAAKTGGRRPRDQ